jgi:hypothetical protein
MRSVKQQILDELSSLEENVAKLRGVAVGASKQTNLEVAILTEQLKTLRDKNEKAALLVEESIKVLEGAK